MPDLLATKAAIRKVLGHVGQALGVLELDTNVTTVADTAERTRLRVHNVLDTTNDEFLDISAQGTTGYIIQSNKAGTGVVRPLTLKSGANITFTTDANGNILFTGGGYARFYDNMLKYRGSGGLFMYSTRTSAITADRDITEPLLTANDTRVYEAHTQTLTNKTLTTPTLTTPTINGTKWADPAAKTGNYTLTATDSIIRADASGSEFTLTLPAAATAGAGTTYTIIREDVASSVNRLIIDANASELINSNLTYVLYPAESIIIECDGTGWECISQPEPTASGYYFEKGATANRRYIAGQVNSNAALIASSTAVVANTLWAMPIIVSRTTKFDTISAEVTTLGSGSNMRLGIYADSGNCYPDVLIYDSANISAATTGVKDSTITASLQVFNPGLYWLTYEHSATIPQIRSLPGSGYIPLFPGTLGTTIPGYAYSVAHTVGALPNPFTAGAAIRTAVSAAASPVPAVGLRAV